jgi:hypothetical protein
VGQRIKIKLIKILIIHEEIKEYRLWVLKSRKRTQQIPRRWI